MSATWCAMRSATSDLNGAPFVSTAASAVIPTFCPGTHVGLLVGNEIGGDEEAVLEIVDADRGGLVIRDGAEMPGDLEPAPVRLLHGGRELRARDVHVRLERRRAGIGPEARHARGVRGVLQLVHLREIEPGPLEVGRGGVHPRAGLLAARDLLRRC